MELARLTPRLRDIAVGPVRRNGKEREGALPATAEALAGATPRIAFARPYSVDFTGWLDDFSHSGNYDALGGFARIGTHVNAFSFKNGVIAPIAPALRAESFKEPRRRWARTTAARARPSATPATARPRSSRRRTSTATRPRSRPGA